MTDLGGLLRQLQRADVSFIIVGGLAAVAHGSPRATFDLDVVYHRSDDRQLLPHTVDAVVFGRSCRCLDLDTLIRVKRAAGRVKDFEAIAELELIRDELRKRGP